MIKKFIKTVFETAGLDIRRLRPVVAEPPIPHPFVHFGIDVVFDIGANKGQYALELRRSGYLGKIISFEPLPHPHRDLVENAKSDPQWVIHERVALGASKGSSVINISGNSLSSSLLPMLQSHSSAAPESVYIGAADVDIITLDSVFEVYAEGCLRPSLKIDAQGFEHQVLEGATNSLNRIACILIELSTVPLYENQKTYDWFTNYFNSCGYQLWWLKPGFSDPKTGQTLQFDACFVNCDRVDDH
jgi:FkbM family methyltransferase